MTPDTITVTKVIPIADADGVAIRIGSVLREINDGCRGIVVKSMKVGDRGTVFDQAGDLHIWQGPGSIRVTNRYNQWRHIPNNEQTYKERYVSWLRTPHNEYLSMLAYGETLSKDTRVAIAGIMALLPSDAVDWESGPWPDTIEQALAFMQEHLTKISLQE